MRPGTMRCHLMMCQFVLRDFVCQPCILFIRAGSLESVDVGSPGQLCQLPAHLGIAPLVAFHISRQATTQDAFHAETTTRWTVRCLGGGKNDHLCHSDFGAVGFFPILMRALALHSGAGQVFWFGCVAVNGAPQNLQVTVRDAYWMCRPGRGGGHGMNSLFCGSDPLSRRAQQTPFYGFDSRGRTYVKNTG
jgi:hypothetical protein